MEKPICIVCGEKKVEYLTSDFWWYFQEFELVKCEGCLSHFIDPSKVDKSIYDKIYEGGINKWYERYAQYAESILKQKKPLLWLAHREPAYGLIFEYLKNKVKENSVKILEVWCGLWYMTYALNKAWYHCKGIDLSTNAVEKAKNRFGDFYEAIEVDKIKEWQYDVVIATEVIEHIDQPSIFLRSCYKTLKKWWVCLITTPNKDFWHKQAYRGSDLPPVHVSWISHQWLYHLWKQNTSAQNTEVIDRLPANYFDIWYNLFFLRLFYLKQKLQSHSIIMETNESQANRFSLKNRIIESKLIKYVSNFFYLLFGFQTESHLLAVKK